jgi:uncharacterized caspase-like protein
MSRRSLARLLVSAAVLLGASPALAENRLALVIGQSAYKSVPVLPNPANDAKAMTQLLTDSGFQVVSASDLSQSELRAKVSEFAGEVATKGADTVALVFYAGHGLQVDGENFLVPTDVDPKREADIPIQAVRLNDVLNTLNSVPSKMRILLLDACRNNPFPELRSAAHGFAIVDAKTGAPGTFLSFSTSPGAEAEDGDGSNSPYTRALLAAAKQSAPIEETFKRVRVAVNKATDGRQTPWDSSSLTEDFRFVAGPAAEANAAAPKLASTRRTVEEWKRELRGKPVEAANEIIVADGTDEAYEAFAALYASTPRGLQARDWLDRHRRMVAWNNAVVINTATGYRAFLAQYPDSDLTATARRLEERLRNRPNMALALAAPVSVPVANAALTCPCNAPSQPAPIKRVDTPARKRAEPAPPKRASAPRPRFVDEEDVVVVRRPPPRVVYQPAGPPVSIGIGIGIGGGYGRPGGYGGRGDGWTGRRSGY